MPKISYIIPCYYNEKNLPPLFERLRQTRTLFPADVSFEYILVDDGSKDETWNVIEALHQENPNHVKGIKLVQNVGAHRAIWAGLHYASGDCHAILAADLQDPPELIQDMFAHWQKGFRLVLAHRTERDEQLRRKGIANLFHWMFKTFAMKNAPSGGFDLLLFDRKLTQEILKMNESGLHVPYALLSLGYVFASIPYKREKRLIGQSRWTFWKKVKLSVDSFVGYSYAPIRLISAAAFLIAFLFVGYGSLVFGSYFLRGNPVEGWTSLMVVILAVSSFQLLALGILGEYLWRTLDTVRQRPKYLVDQELIQTS